MTGTSAATITIKRLDELPSASRQLLEHGNDIKIWLFNGDMGAGKTTLIKSICQELKVIDQVSSPTFSLVNEYLTESGQVIYHFDFYRIKDEAEAFHIGADDYFYSGNLCLIEWPEKVKNIIPEECLEINITVSDKIRILQLFIHEK